jgi:hypothetical protein
MTRANSAKQLTLGGNLAYHDEHNIDSAFFTAFKSSQANAPQTKRWEIGNDFRHLLGEHWYVNTIQNFLSSEEQQLSLRTTLGGGGAVSVSVRSQHLALGVEWLTNERYTIQQPTKNSAEAYKAPSSTPKS